MELEVLDALWRAYTFAAVVVGTPVMEPWEQCLTVTFLIAVCTLLGFLLANLPVLVVTCLSHLPVSTTASFSTVSPYVKPPVLPAAHILGHDLACNITTLLNDVSSHLPYSDVVDQMHFLLANVTHALRSHHLHVSS